MSGAQRRLCLGETVVLAKLWISATNRGRDGRTIFGAKKGSSGKYRKRGLYVAPSQFLHQQFVEVLRYRGELRTLLNVC
jgi:hypothetical protein